jgi:hypothetical protein
MNHCMLKFEENHPKYISSDYYVKIHLPNSMENFQVNLHEQDQNVIMDSKTAKVS